MLKRLAEWEEDKFNDLIERNAEQYPEWFWDESNPRPPLRLGPVLQRYWPSKLSFSYWYWLINDLEGNYWASDNAYHWINLPDPITDWYEWRYWLKNLRSPKYFWIRLWEETKTERLICRMRGHPQGEVFWNPGGSEPDHHCRGCGDNIG